jgi:hypothetical protein
MEVAWLYVSWSNRADLEVVTGRHPQLCATRQLVSQQDEMEGRSVMANWSYYL